MKLVKIGKFYINPEAIDEIEGNDKKTFIGMRSNNSLNASLPIEKVLQAISGSQEHLRIEGDAAKKVVSNKKNHLR
ncbi:hypothetical protein NVV76_05920 [Pediococcus ethanolidurans]|uniref:hypothetical protein n=1 Tax=Pediococcus ethanolidurans TaxID=319653 RepID=UPI0021E88BBC|nr:hypothetical protein [Pediococcus ethanolidurans]MCV3327697.1 hypothetical protein [Pediococcus ethanolidurans]